MLDESKLQRGELKSIAKVLLKMQESKNDGRGVEEVKTLARYLKKGLVQKSIEYARETSHVFLPYPEIRRFVHDVIYPIGYLDPETGLLVNDK